MTSWSRLRRWFRRRRGGAPKPIQDYLYVDENRLSGYVQQSGGPKAYESSYTLSAEASVKPKVGASTTRVRRQATSYEKIAFLEQRLEEVGQLGRGRWNGDQDKTFDFRVESCLARRLVLADSSGRRLGAWISRYNPTGRTGRPLLLLLFEGVATTDDQPHYLSSMSTFVTLVEAAVPKLLLPPGVTRDETSIESVTERLVKNPVGFLRELDAEALAERSVRTLYRVRYGVVAMVSGAIPPVVTIGYPIYIAEAPRDSVEGEVVLYDNRDAAVEITDEQRAEWDRMWREELGILEDDDAS